MAVWTDRSAPRNAVSLLLLILWKSPKSARQKEAFARNQKLMFALERGELEWQALDARLHLLQAQVAPHFLFNTPANVLALVDAGSPHASAVLRSLTAARIRPSSQSGCPGARVPPLW